ncbi:MAG: Recombinase [Parcubacteria group bacterium]|nr:Recombinase [Parcubacteria group bacterium]
MKTKFFLYARKSTEDEERQVMSIEAQLAELAEFAKRENIEIAETFIESKSAKKPGREIFNEMGQGATQSNRLALCFREPCSSSR